jgi:hypothetical protein
MASMEIKMTTFWRLAATLIVVTALAACGGSPAPVAIKPILDSTFYTGKPATLAKNFTPVYTDGWYLFEDCVVNADGSLALATPTADGGISESGTKHLAHYAKSIGATRIIFDLEGPQLTPANCMQILTWVRSEKVALPLAFFSLPTTPDYGPVLKACDFICPCVYYNEYTQFADDPGVITTWQQRLLANVTATKALAPGKTCLTFICPRWCYAGGADNHLLWDVLPPDLLTMTTEYALSISNGIVVWDPALDPITLQTLDWSAASAWYPTVEKR